jgi:hypothetical protein
VGLPRESRISRAWMASISAMDRLLRVKRFAGNLVGNQAGIVLTTDVPVATQPSPEWDKLQKLIPHRT